MRNALLLLFALLPLESLYAQNTYSTYIQSAKEILRIEDDSLHYSKALGLIESAFRQFPDSIEGEGLYKAAAIASKTNKLDKAFKFLNSFLQLKEDNRGYPTWFSIIDGYSLEDFNLAMLDPRWEVLEEQALTKKKTFYHQLIEKEEEFFKTRNLTVEAIDNTTYFYNQLASFNQYIPKRHQNYSIRLPIIDSLTTSYFVHLPKNYSSNNTYPLLFVLHDAVYYSSISDFSVEKEMLGGDNSYYVDFADKNNVILVFPKGNAEFNWVNPDDGFFMLTKILREVKQTLNIDENKVFVSGTGQGAIGAFSYMLKNPTPFAGFYGFNTYPKVFTGGTFIENMSNRSFISFSTADDLYPENAKSSMDSLMKVVNLDYTTYRYNKSLNKHHEAKRLVEDYKALFKDISQRERNPFPSEITWELDDNNHGNIDWLEEITLDTLQPRKKWHYNRNFDIKSWKRINEKNIRTKTTYEVNLKAFDFPRKSGKIIAKHKKNKFKISTSCIGSFKLKISPKMVKTNRKVKVFVNGKVVFNDKVDFDVPFALKNFNKTLNRTQIWVNEIEIKL